METFDFIVTNISGVAKGLLILILVWGLVIMRSKVNNGAFIFTVRSVSNDKLNQENIELRYKLNEQNIKLRAFEQTEANLNKELTRKEEQIEFWQCKFINCLQHELSDKDIVKEFREIIQERGEDNDRAKEK